MQSLNLFVLINSPTAKTDKNKKVLFVDLNSSLIDQHMRKLNEIPLEKRMALKLDQMCLIWTPYISYHLMSAANQAQESLKPETDPIPLLLHQCRLVGQLPREWPAKHSCYCRAKCNQAICLSHAQSTLEFAHRYGHRLTIQTSRIGTFRGRSRWALRLRNLSFYRRILKQM